MPVHLHVHSWYSLLEGLSSPEALLERAAACGYGSLALTDTNNLLGARAFVEQAAPRGIRPLLGARLQQQEVHCTVLAAQREGYNNLCRILSRLHLSAAPVNGGRKSPDNSTKSRGLRPPLAFRLADLLNENAEGLHVLVDNRRLAEQLREAFGARLWLEVIRPGRSAAQEQELLAWAKRLGLKPVASAAAAMATSDAYPALAPVTAVRHNTLLDQLPARLPVSPEHHLVDLPTFRRRFHDLPQAVANTDLLAEQLRSDVLPRQVILPTPHVPHCLDEVRFLNLLCERGLRRRELGPSLSARQRLREELAVIEATDLAGYFLVVRDIARHARRRGHSMALRGSAGNSLVCFLLEITDVDPLRFNLPMERFLHPGRTDLPDIDLDFDWKVRDEVIEHVCQRYGPRYTARISSHLFLQPRSAFREAGKIHGLSNVQVSELLESLSTPVEGLLSESGRAGDVSPLISSSHQGAYAPRSPALAVPRGFPLEDARWPRLVADARWLLGRPHHLSIHPGGVVITPRPIEEYVPLQMAPKGVIITQFDKDGVEYIGLVKIDLLGNRALATVDEAVGHVRAVEGRDEDRGWRIEDGGWRIEDGGSRIEPKLQLGTTLPRSSASPPTQQNPSPSSTLHPPFSILHSRSSILDLPSPAAALHLLQSGDTLGVNQLESPAMRHLLVQMQPRGVGDVIQALALIRPGAASIGMKEVFIRRRRGLEPTPPLPADLEPFLRETEGLMLYEDDALQVVQALTGLAAPDADRFRKRVTKHRTEEEAWVLSREFLEICARNGVSRAVAAAWWVQLAKFNQYSFCKSHSVSYGLIAWKAVQLKVHYPICFWTAALNNNQGMYPRRVYVEAIKRAGIEMRLPCVNRSAGPFTIERGSSQKQTPLPPPTEKGTHANPYAAGGEGSLRRERVACPGAIRAGLDAIGSLDDAVKLAVLEERARHGPYRDLADFRRRVPIGPEALALFIRSGALDFTGQPRPALFLEADLQDRTGGPAQELFPHEPLDGWLPTDYARSERLREEYRILGFLPGPPLITLFRAHLPPDRVFSHDIAHHRGQVIRVAGLVATARNTNTDAGKPMQFITLEDEHGLVDVTLFPGSCPLIPYLTAGPYIATGVVEEQYGVLSVTASKFELVQPGMEAEPVQWEETIRYAS
ncbi:MAG: DNA polymerase III subunit alpha [Gemmataceae bacterium]